MYGLHSWGGHGDMSPLLFEAAGRTMFRPPYLGTEKLHLSLTYKKMNVNQ